METSITVLARGRMHLREAMWNLEEVSGGSAQDHPDRTCSSVFVSCREQKRIVRLLEIPQKRSNFYRKKTVRKWQADNLRRAQQNNLSPSVGFRRLTDCTCRMCSARRRVKEARASLTKDFQQWESDAQVGKAY